MVLADWCLMRAHLLIAHGCLLIVFSCGGKQREKKRQRGDRDRDIEGAWALMFLTPALIPLKRPPISWPTHLSKTPPPSTIALNVRISTYRFWEDTNIQSTTLNVFYSALHALFLPSTPHLKRHIWELIRCIIACKLPLACLCYFCYQRSTFSHRSDFPFLKRLSS